MIQPPVAGKFEGNVGTFEGHDTFNSIPILVRYTWTVNPKSSQVAETWERRLNPEGLQLVAKWSTRSLPMTVRPGDQLVQRIHP